MEAEDIMRTVEMAQIMFKNHPELCPHDMEWVSQLSNHGIVKETKYRCKVCGKEEVVIEMEEINSGKRSC